jgi:hypothetical protein
MPAHLILCALLILGLPVEGHMLVITPSLDMGHMLHEEDIGTLP